MLLPGPGLQRPAPAGGGTGRDEAGNCTASLGGQPSAMVFKGLQDILCPGAESAAQMDAQPDADLRQDGMQNLRFHVR